MSFLSLKNLRKVYPDGTEAVKGIDLAVEGGEFVVLLGPSGCGKTTTLRMIAGLEIASGGSIELDGDDVTTLRPAQRDVGFVFQFYALYPHLNVRDNIAFPLVSAGTPSVEVHANVDRVAERVGLTNLLRMRPNQLSGGDQQRVALARAMVRKPRLWLMDEPLGTLDADKRLEMREFIRAQQQDAQVTTIYVTHDQEEAMSLADRIVVMNGGSICQVGTPDEVYQRPADLFVANFVGSPGMNFIRRDDGKTIGVRCEHVRLGGGGELRGKIVLDEYLGSHRLIHIETPVARLIARDTSHAVRSIGEEVSVDFDKDFVNVFGADGRRI